MNQIRLLIVFLSAVWLSSAGPAFGNGGVFDLSVVRRTGDLVPVQKRSISLEKEDLYIRIDEDDATVDVAYELFNHGLSDSVTFGFPVDIATVETASTPNGYDYVLGNSFRDFEIKDGTTRVAIAEVIDKPLSAKDRPRNVDPKLHLFRRWSMVTLKFERGERKQLHVSYKVRCAARDEGFEGDIDWKFGHRTFFYTFSPAASWGSGRVKNLNVTLDIRWLRERYLSLVRVGPGGGSEERGQITWRFQDKDLSTLSDLICVYDPSAFYIDRLVRRNLIEPESIKSVKASSVLPREGLTQYDEAAMLDNDLRTVWVEGVDGPGIGQSIIFEPKDAYVTNIGILNGYVVDESRYYANARIKKLRVELEFLGANEQHGKREVREVDMPDRPYKNLNPHYPSFSSVDWILHYPEGDEAAIKAVKLTILGVYPGRQYEDCAITELYICAFKRELPKPVKK